MDTKTSWEIAAGTGTGRDHRQSGRNSQDAFCWTRSGDALIVVVADGCGSGPRNEVGAGLGARMVAEGLRRRCLDGVPADLDPMLDDVRREVLATLAPVARALGGALPATVSDHLLFTIVGAVLTRDAATVFGAGDGVWCVDGRLHVVTAPGDAPAYLGYGLLDGADAGPGLRVWSYAPGAQHVLIGTDGAGDLHAHTGQPLPANGTPVPALETLAADAGWYANPFALTRWLRVAGRDAPRGAPSILADDTTLALARRRPEEP